MTSQSSTSTSTDEETAVVRPVATSEDLNVSMWLSAAPWLMTKPMVMFDSAVSLIATIPPATFNRPAACVMVMLPFSQLMAVAVFRCRPLKASTVVPRATAASVAGDSAAAVRSTSAVPAMSRDRLPPATLMWPLVPSCPPMVM